MASGNNIRIYYYRYVFKSPLNFPRFPPRALAQYGPLRRAVGGVLAGWVPCGEAGVSASGVDSVARRALEFGSRVEPLCAVSVAGPPGGIPCGLFSCGGP